METSVDARAQVVHRRRVTLVNGPTPQTGHAEELAIVEAARRGDRTAFGRLHERYARMVHGMLLARVPVAEAEDLTQEVFLAAMRSIHTLRQGLKFGPWIAGIARHRAVDFHRRRRPVGVLPDEVPRTQPPRAEAREALEAVRALPAAYRETLLMRLVEGMSGPEIARRTGLTPGSVRVNLHRGMKLLKQRLGAEEKSG